MAERKYRQIDSPWIDMSHLDWGPLTDERYARHFFPGAYILWPAGVQRERLHHQARPGGHVPVYAGGRYAQHHGAGCRMHVRQPDPV